MKFEEWRKKKKTISTSESVNGRRWNRNKEYRWEQNRHLPKSLWSRSLLRETNDNGSLCPSPLGLSSSSSRSPSWRSFLLLSKFCDSNNFNCCWCNRFLIKNIFGILSSVLFLLMCSKRYFLFDQVFVIWFILLLIVRAFEFDWVCFVLDPVFIKIIKVLIKIIHTLAKRSPKFTFQFI